MVRLQADFRRRHNLPPVKNAWTLVEAIETLKTRSALNDARILRSPRAGIGKAVETARHAFWKLLKPVFDRQTEVNRGGIGALQMLMRECERNQEANLALMARVQRLEAEVKRLGGRPVE